MTPLNKKRSVSTLIDLQIRRIYTSGRTWKYDDIEQNDVVKHSSFNSQLRDDQVQSSLSLVNHKVLEGGGVYLPS